MDRMKDYMIHDATNLKHGSVRMTVSTTAIKKMKFWSDDAKQAFIQCEQEGRYIALIPPEEVELPKNLLLK